MIIDRALGFVGRKVSRLTGNDPAQLLFRGEDQLFIDAVSKCSIYGEYGCGASTVWCADNSDVPIMSVDSSAEWIAKVQADASRTANLSLEHVNLGTLGDWGRPRDYKHRASFSRYVDALWNHEAKPDLILVDGRFRVACFLRSLLNADVGSTILFDDYTERPNYHVVEEFVDRGDSLGTMAKFVVPEKLDAEAIEREIGAFSYVMD